MPVHRITHDPAELLPRIARTSGESTSVQRTHLQIHLHSTSIVTTVLPTSISGTIVRDLAVIQPSLSTDLHSRLTPTGDTTIGPASNQATIQLKSTIERLTICLLVCRGRISSMAKECHCQLCRGTTCRDNRSGPKDGTFRRKLKMLDEHSRLPIVGAMIGRSTLVT